METRFLKTKGELNAFAILSPGLLLTADTYGRSRHGRRTLVGEFLVLDFTLLECEGVSRSEEFAFAGTTKQLRELCEKASTAIRVICDPRFVISPDHSGKGLRDMAERFAGRKPRDFRYLSWKGEPLRTSGAADEMWPGWQYRSACRAVDAEAALEASGRRNGCRTAGVAAANP